MSICYADECQYNSSSIGTVISSRTFMNLKASRPNNSQDGLPTFHGVSTLKCPSWFLYLISIKFNQGLLLEHNFPLHWPFHTHKAIILHKEPLLILHFYSLLLRPIETLKLRLNGQLQWLEVVHQCRHYCYPFLISHKIQRMCNARQHCRNIEFSRILFAPLNDVSLGDRTKPASHLHQE